MDPTQSPNSQPKHHLLTLPAEIRLLIYTFIFPPQTHIIQRKPILFPCAESNQPLPFHRNLMHPPPDFPICSQSHPSCSSLQSHILNVDMHIGNRTMVSSPHYPCPHSLTRNPALNLNFLATCHQVYREARHLLYQQTVFWTQEVGSFSNFMCCLKNWQVREIRHLRLRLPSDMGMDMYLWEWNEVFALIGRACSGLRSVGVEVHTIQPKSTWRDIFWDGGLLGLDRLRLEGLRFVVYKREGDTGLGTVYFDYQVGVFPPSDLLSSPLATTPVLEAPEAPGASETPEVISFHEVRNTLRHVQNVPITTEPGRLFLRLSPNLLPLYISNLIHMLPRRHHTHAEIRREDRYQREYVYHYAYPDDDTEQENPVFGFQFSEELKDDEQYIARGLARLRESRKRLARKAMEGGGGLGWVKKPEVRRGIQGKRVVLEGEEEEEEKAGDWRRRLTQETYAPFIEAFPMTPALPQKDLSKCCFHCRSRAKM
ncbi:hypothetical protein BO70DRAFT_380696 [Aspergillus heteromorphus CBS 117.55]|uniref:DUF7730 domain-containing protein n=1 Tax=Aspergillus heteromorphus CBS 117.55 TaxID=1448321 RepID=A0A317VZX3_9EURO|nr:uncharacterized protein BO70DRAFT_380696 [Aspergillus heteromorphus CBS 117.55]PWY77440.1 hypothetical protein BO70DRAFT_380696 [Aspergillus heteromorphus CBS 117.55]